MEELQDKYVRFDWAIKRLLRQKANFDVLEGFLTVFLGEKVTILEILESESNQLSAEDKFNRVDIKAVTVRTRSSLSRYRIPANFIIWSGFFMALPRLSLSISRWVKRTIR